MFAVGASVNPDAAIANGRAARRGAAPTKRETFSTRVGTAGGTASAETSSKQQHSPAHCAPRAAPSMQAIDAVCAAQGAHKPGAKKTK